MKKLLALACAVSALALSSGAQADDTFGLTLAANVGNVCGLASGQAASATKILTTSATGITGQSGYQSVSVAGNTTCHYKLSSTNHGLGAPQYDYSANLSGDTANPSPISVKTPGNFSTTSSDLSSTGTDTVTINYAILDTAAPAGRYTDTLNLAITVAP
jgi:hypothetical protein